MLDAFAQLQHILLSGNSSYAHVRLRRQIDQMLGELDPVDRACTQALRRLSQAAERFGDPDARPNTGTADLMVLTRQVIRSFGRTLDFPQGWWQKIEFRASDAGLFPSTMDERIATIHAQSWSPTWLTDSQDEELGSLTYSRTQQAAPGDGMLSALSNGVFTTYRSEGQKAAVDAVVHASPGTTLLITLPTGGGKSLCILLPAWLASGGGRFQGGTTIVVVPTVSLALDQQEHVREIFRTSVGPTYRPYALLGDTGNDVRSTIYDGIRDGTLPILYTSPESLLNNARLQEVVLSAAAKGTINWLVIDEAHMVDQWGAGFRTEFQLLAALRKQLLDLSAKRMRTLLLSATVSNRCKQTLDELFGDGCALSTVMANQLRPEISYWVSSSITQEQRRGRVLEALYHLPRPAILYVTRPDDAEEWVSYLRSQGFERLAAYTGKTAALERTQIMREWTINERDLIVATSAFGLGVDKENVRTVIHATLPENVDRFYQEVGRGGRDGCRSISLLCVVPEEDLPLARSMNLRSRITVEKAWPRWYAMWNKRKPTGDGDAHYWVDLEAAPYYNPEMDATDTHRNWNEHILLLMQRAGLLKIHSTRAPQGDTDKESDEVTPRRWLHIELVAAHVTYSQEAFEAAFDPHRQYERNDIQTSLEQMIDLVRSFSSSAAAPISKTCIGKEFTLVYPFTAYACGGCPACRSQGMPPGSAPVRVDIDLNAGTVLTQSAPLATHVEPLFTPQPHLHLIWEGTEYPQEKLAILLPQLLQAGFKQFVIPIALVHLEQWLSSVLNRYMQIPLMPSHRILTDEMLLGHSLSSWTLYPWPTVIVYPTEAARADAIYRAVKAKGKEHPLVQIVSRQLYLASEHGRFLDRVNGRHIMLDSFIAQLQRNLETI